MEHVVFSSAEGGAGQEFRRVSSLEEAVRVVEHLRNDLAVTDPSVYALTPVPLAYRTYYKVEVPGADLPVEALPVAEPPSAELAALVEAPPGEAAFASSTAQDEFAFEPSSDVPVPVLLPAASAIPGSRQDDDAERSLGYFAR